MPVEIRHQVFVSSTFEDLQEERRAVIDGLLQEGCFPCGMEYCTRVLSTNPTC